jgi:diaminopimelate epimerase
MQRSSNTTSIRPLHPDRRATCSYLRLVIYAAGFLMTLQFTKMSGAGNDFVVIDNRSGAISDPRSLARRLCDRRWGVGADGLLLLEKSDKDDYRMMYYNADGSYGGMCGNGGRCLAYYAFLKKFAGAHHAFEALGTRYEASVESDHVALRMANPSDLRLELMLPYGGRPVIGHFVDTGAPHVVVKSSDLSSEQTFDDIDLQSFGRATRHHSIFRPHGTNVNVVYLESANQLKIRTYERGVEEETLACGTGSIAAAVIGAMVWKMEAPITVIPRSGHSLMVDFRLTSGEVTDVVLTGPAVVTFEGVVTV